MKPFHFIPLILLSLLPACSEDVVDTTGSIIGTVTDAQTNQVLHGVLISTSPLGKTATTGSDGSYAMGDVPAQNYDLQAEKAGYGTAKKSVNVEIGKENRVDFLLYPSVPNMVVSKNTFDFGSESTTLSFEISNNGLADLSWQINENVSWLTSTPASGTVAQGQKTSVALTVDRVGLNRGNYSQTIAVTSNGGSYDLLVNMAVQGAMVSADPIQLDFESIVLVRQLILKNNGTKTVPYNLTASKNWIYISKTSGVLQGGVSEQIDISVNREGLSPGSYSGEISLVCDGTTTSIPVNMNIVAKSKPTVNIAPIEVKGYSKAVFKGAIISVGSAKVTRHGFCWGTSENPVVEGNSNISNFGDSEESVQFDYTVENLKENTVYYVRAYAENIEGISYSQQEKFQAPGFPTMPGASTGTASNVTATGAEFVGRITSLGNVEKIMKYGHVWSTVEQPTLESVGSNKTAYTDAYAATAFTSLLTGLRPHVTYHVRAYATNSEGTAYGEDMSFTTDYASVELTAGTVTDITSKTAKLAASITSKGGHSIKERGICWSTTGSPTLSHSHISSTSQADNYTCSLSGLTALTAYYARAYVKTETDKIFYSDNVVNFTTSAKEVDITIEDLEDEEFWQK